MTYKRVLRISSIIGILTGVLIWLWVIMDKGVIAKQIDLLFTVGAIWVWSACDFHQFLFHNRLRNRKPNAEPYGKPPSRLLMYHLTRTRALRLFIIYGRRTGWIFVQIAISILTFKLLCDSMSYELLTLNASMALFIPVIVFLFYGVILIYESGNDYPQYYQMHHEDLVDFLTKRDWLRKEVNDDPFKTEYRLYIRTRWEKFIFNRIKRDLETWGKHHSILDYLEH